MPSTSTFVKDSRRRKTTTIVWLTILTAVTVFLLYREMIAVLYILATLGVTALLAVVGMADLGRSETDTLSPERIDDSAAIRSGISSVPGKNKA